MYLTDEMQFALGEIARRSQRSKAEVIREAVAALIAGQKRPRPKSIGMIEDDDVQSTNVNDWLKTNWSPE